MRQIRRSGRLREGNTDNENPDGADRDPGGLIMPKRLSTNPPASSGARSLTWSFPSILFKTCADFDEGGAHALLMNHLSSGVGIDEGGLRVVFNVSDAVAKSGDGEEADLLRLFG